MHRLLLLVVALIIYGSLYPWNFDFGSEGRPTLMAWPGTWDRFEIRNLLINVLIYMPLGLLAHATLRQRARSVSSAIGAMALGLTLSITIELMQVHLPSRYSSGFDILCNGVGTAAGIVLAQFNSEIMRRILERAARTGFIHPSRSLMLVYCWVGYQLFPLFPALSLSALALKLEVLSQNWPTSATDILLAFGEFLALAKLLELSLGARSLRSELLFLLLLVPAKLFLARRTLTWDELCGAIAGYAVWSSGIDRSERRSLYAVAVLSLAVLVAGLAPFHFQETGTSFSWVPFGALLGADWWAGILVLLHKTFWYGALVVLWHEAGLSVRNAIFGVASALAGIEVMQLYLPGRVSEITDPLFAVLLGLALLGVRARADVPETTRTRDTHAPTG